MHASASGKMELEPTVTRRLSRRLAQCLGDAWQKEQDDDGGGGLHACSDELQDEGRSKDVHAQGGYRQAQNRAYRHYSESCKRLNIQGQRGVTGAHAGWSGNGCRPGEESG